MKHYIKTSALALLTCISACISEEPLPVSNPEELTITASHFTGNRPASKTTLTPFEKGIHVAWAENDKIRIIQKNAGTYASTDLLLKDGAGSQTATFKGDNFATSSDNAQLQYEAFYPATIEGNTPESWKGNATYEGQTQNGYNNTEHLANFDYLTATTTDNLEKPLQFTHLGVVFCFDITLPPSAKALPKSLTLTTVDGNDTPTAAGGLFKNCNRSETSSLTLLLQGCTTTSATFKAYMMCHCNIPNGQRIQATLTLQDGNTYTHTLTARQAISSMPQSGHNEGISYVIPISEWNERPNSVFNAETPSRAFQGTGTEADPYLIENAENLKYLIEQENEYYSKYFLLKSDITIENIAEWSPIGKKRTFKGNFNGNGHTIQGELTKSTEMNHIGLFSKTDNATISNLNVRLNITNDSCLYVGGVVAKAIRTTITNCHFDGSIAAGRISGNLTFIGGIVAHADRIQIKGCTSRGTIRQNEQIMRNDFCMGGIAGIIDNYSTVTQCENHAEVRGGINEGGHVATVSGITGRVSPDGQPHSAEMTDCYNYGTIYGGSFKNKTSMNSYNASGIIGCAKKVKLTRVYNYGAIHAQPNHTANFTGGIIGHAYTGEISLLDCANYGEVTGHAQEDTPSYTGGLIGHLENNEVQLHRGHNAGNVSVVTENPANPNIYTGSYVGFATPKQIFVYSCCSTAPGVIIKNGKGESVAAGSPQYYIGNGKAITECPDKHTAAK